MTKVIVPIVFISILFGVIGYAICSAPTMLRSEYTSKISVDAPDKIENAISNAVADLEKRDFVPVDLDVLWDPTSKTYVVYARGIDRTKLSKWEP